MLRTRSRSNGIVAIAIAFALAASNLAFAPQPAHAQPEANEVVIVQNMTPIGSAEEYDALFPSGYPSADRRGRNRGNAPLRRALFCAKRCRDDVLAEAADRR